MEKREALGHGGENILHKPLEVYELLFLYLPE